MVASLRFDLSHDGNQAHVTTSPPIMEDNLTLIETFAVATAQLSTAGDTYSYTTPAASVSNVQRLILKRTARAFDTRIIYLAFPPIRNADLLASPSLREFNFTSSPPLLSFFTIPCIYYIYESRHTRTMSTLVLIQTLFSLCCIFF